MVNNIYMMIYLVCLLCIVNYWYGQVAFINISNRLIDIEIRQNIVIMGEIGVKYSQYGTTPQ